MLNLKVIGAGAAGNKAAIALMERGFKKENVILINSTKRDIPAEYQENSIIFGTANTTLGGCGKERKIGKKLLMDDLKNNRVQLDNIADVDTNAVIIVASTEGGTGSAAAPLIAKYMRDVVNVPVIVALLFGFNNDVRGMQNSIELSKELQDDYGVICICNDRFLTDDNNTTDAEREANEKFADIVITLSGVNIYPSHQNIDDTDLLKIVTTPGYMMVESADIGKIKSKEQYNKTIMDIVANTKLMSTNNGAKRIGVVYNINKNVSNFIDTSATSLKNSYGTPYEFYSHIQEVDKASVEWIASGLPMPIAEIRDIHDKYLNFSNEVNKQKDLFFSDIGNLEENEDDSMFDMLGSAGSKKAKEDFFNSMESSNKSKPAIEEY